MTEWALLLPVLDFFRLSRSLKKMGHLSTSSHYINPPTHIYISRGHHEGEVRKDVQAREWEGVLKSCPVDMT